MLALASLLAVVGTVAPVGGGNALTLPAARHMVRMELGGGRAAILLALQQDGAEGHMLNFLRSDDEGASWRHYAPIQDIRNDRDTVDLIASGSDIAVVFSYEGPELVGSAAHDVFFQWWRFDGLADWKPQPAIRIFDSTSATSAFYRGLVARDSVGRIWVQAFELKADGTGRAAIAVSSNGGASFTRLPDLGSTPARGGGRLIHLGNRMMFLWGSHATNLASMRFHDDASDPASWTPPVTAWSEGIYHGAALSAVADGQGGLHLVYKDSVVGQLFYRRFNGNSWGARTLIEPVVDWATQPALTLVGGSLYIFYNHPITTNTNFTFVYRILNGTTMGAPVTLRSTHTFKGYPASIEKLPTSVAQVPCVFGDTVDANSGGTAGIVFASASGAVDPPPPPPPPPPPSANGALFSDDFQRSAPPYTLGPAWTVAQGGWFPNGRFGVSGLSGGNRALTAGVTCADCQVDSKLIAFGTEAGLILRSQANGDRYEMVLAATGSLQIRRVRGGVATALGQVAGGIANPGDWTSFTFRAQGSGPVTLTVALNGVLKLAVEDASPQAIAAAGAAGMTAQVAGIVFDDFVLTGSSAVPPPPPPPPPSAGVLFSDDFQRSAPPYTLGAGWTVAQGGWFPNGRFAVSGLSGGNRATVAGVSCADCHIDSKLDPFGTEAGLVLRSQPNGDRYEMALLPTGTVQIRRWRAGVSTVLGQVASGILNLRDWTSFTFTAHGAGSVALSVAVNGVLKLQVDDSSAQAISGGGGAGLTAASAGVVFDDFVVASP